MKLYTREELWAMNGTRFAEVYTHMNAWARAIFGETPAADTTLDFVLIVQSKMLVIKTVQMNRLREMELMGLEASAALFRSS